MRSTGLSPAGLLAFLLLVSVLCGQGPGPAPAPRVLLGIDVLAADHFALLQGKRVGLLTQAAGRNRDGVSTVDVLLHAPGVRLVCLFAPEHGIDGVEPASTNLADSVDAKTGLPVYSLHGRNRRPTRRQLRTIDTLVVDLQDIGVRSYTYAVTMRYAMEACFLAGVDVVVLDRPNPLGGVKVDGPLLDRSLMSGVGGFPVPYVHGLTIGELARLAAGTPGVMDIPEKVRQRGRLTVVPMRGWRRDMRWPDTGLTFVPTSPAIGDFDAVVGYAMIGLGCEGTDYYHSMGGPHSFQILTEAGRTPEQLKAELEGLHLPGLSFRLVSTVGGGGRPAAGVLVTVADWKAWHPTELSFQMMRLECRHRLFNPFLGLGAAEISRYNRIVGSLAWYNALRRDGARVDLEGFFREWRQEDAQYREQTRRFWLYQP